MYPSSVGSSGRVYLLFLFIIILSILLPPLLSNVTIIVSFSIPTIARRNNRAIINSTPTWDGSIASKYNSGDGTEENPYQISSAGEFAYFKELLQSEDATLYSTKEYVITNSFNYGGYDISINNDIAFTGTVNGKGNIISNAVIIAGVSVMLFTVNHTLAAITLVPIPFVFYASTL